VGRAPADAGPTAAPRVKLVLLGDSVRTAARASARV